MRVVVVGAGIMGVASAWFLKEAGFDVLLIEKDAGPGLGTSFANGSLIHPSYVQPWNEPGVHRTLLRFVRRADAPMLLRLRHVHHYLLWGLNFLAKSSPSRFAEASRRNLALAMYSVRVLRGLRADLNLHYDQYFRGSLNIFRDRSVLGVALRIAESLQVAGVDSEMVDRDGLIAIEPALAPIANELRGGIHYKSDEGGDSYLFCQVMGEKLAAAGVEVHYGTEVTRIVGRNGHVRYLETLNGGRIDGDAFVVACAAATTRLLKPLGIRIPIMPVKGYSLTLPNGHDFRSPRVPIIDADLHAGVIPLGADSIRLAGTAEFSAFDESIPQARIDNLFAMLERIFPEYASAVDRDKAMAWAGLRPMSADGTPFIGQTALENLYVNAGHGQIGWSTGPGSARLLADIVSGTGPALDPADYSPDRS